MFIADFGKDSDAILYGQIAVIIQFNEQHPVVFPQKTAVGVFLQQGFLYWQPGQGHRCRKIGAGRQRPLRQLPEQPFGKPFVLQFVIIDLYPEFLRFAAGWRGRPVLLPTDGIGGQQPVPTGESVQVLVETGGVAEPAGKGGPFGRQISYRGKGRLSGKIVQRDAGLGPIDSTNTPVDHIDGSQRHKDKQEQAPSCLIKNTLLFQIFGRGRKETLLQGFSRSAQMEQLVNQPKRPADQCHKQNERQPKAGVDRQ